MTRDDDSYTAGIIGTGGIAGMGILGMHDESKIGSEKVRASHAGGYHASDNIDLIAVADVDEQKLKRFGEAWDIPSNHRYLGHQAMLERYDLDVVSVCTPSYLHREHVIDSAESAANPDVIWCEKPIATSVSDAEKMIDTCDSAGTELMINHSFRFTKKVRKVKQLIEDGLIGDVKAINAQFRRELMRNSTHLLDLIVFFLRERANEILGYINGENDAVEALDGSRKVEDAGGGGIVVTEDGTFITIDCTVARDISSMGIQFIGTEGKLYLNNDDGEWRYWSLEDGDHVERQIPGIDGAWSWDTDYRKAFSAATDHILQILEDDIENISPGTHALRSLEIIIGFYLSHYTGGHVETPLEPPLRDVEIASW